VSVNQELAGGDYRRPAVADLLQVIRTRVMRLLVHRRVVEADTDADTMLLPDDLAERDPALAQLKA
jgi:hypothetical protein